MSWRRARTDDDVGSRDRSGSCGEATTKELGQVDSTGSSTHGKLATELARTTAETGRSHEGMEEALATEREDLRRERCAHTHTHRTQTAGSRVGERGAKGNWIRFSVLSEVTLQNELQHDQQAPCILSSQHYSIHTGNSHPRGSYFKTHMINNRPQTMPLGATRRGMMRGFPGSRRSSPK